MKDKDFRKLKSKANEYFIGKGWLERFMEKISHENLIFIQGDGKIRLEIINGK